MPFVEMTTNGKADDDNEFFSLVDKKPIITCKFEVIVSIS